MRFNYVLFCAVIDHKLKLTALFRCLTTVAVGAIRQCLKQMHLTRFVSFYNSKILQILRLRIKTQQNDRTDSGVHVGGRHRDTDHRKILSCIDRKKIKIILCIRTTDFLGICLLIQL